MIEKIRDVVIMLIAVNLTFKQMPISGLSLKNYGRMLTAVLTNDYWAYLSETFGNVSESFCDYSGICVIPAHDFRLEIPFGI